MKTQITPIKTTATAQAEATIVMHSEYAHRYSPGKIFNASRPLLTGSQDIAATIAARPRKCDRLVISGNPDHLASYCEREFGEKLAHPAIVTVKHENEEIELAQMVMPTIIFGSDPARPGNMTKKRMRGIIGRIHTFASRNVGHEISIRDEQGTLICCG